MTPAPPPVDIRFVTDTACRSALTVTNTTTGTVRLSGGTSDNQPPAELNPGQTIRYRVLTPIGEVVVWHIVADPTAGPRYEAGGTWTASPCIGTPTTVTRRGFPLIRFAMLRHFRWWT